MSASLQWLLALFVVQGMAVAVTISWTSHRIRVNRPIQRWQQVAIMVPLTVLTFATWALSFAD